MNRTRLLCLALACASLWQRASAADPAAPLAVRAAARPSFQITPLVQRFSGRRGQRLRFEFQVQTFDVPQALRIRGVRLKQQLNGLVVADDGSPPSEAIQFSSPLELALQARETAVIRGHVDVPLDPAPFHAFGILVTDLGNPLQVPAEASQTSVGIRFVTQYLLRLEINVENGRQESAKLLRIESAGLVERDGHPYVEADLFNPTDTVVEFRLNARILKSTGAQLIPVFGLAQPVRASRKEPERYDSMVFGQNRVRLSAPVPHALFPGQYALELEWISDRRKCGRASASITVREGDFPGQASRSVQVADALSVTPSQVELSLRSGGSRRVPVKLMNNGTRGLRIRVATRNFDGTTADWLLASPSEFDLPAGTDRNILAMARAGREIEDHRYGFLQVTVGEENGGEVTQELPIALLGRAASDPIIASGPIRWETDGDRPAFVMPVSNRGSVHIPLNARLTIRDAVGQKIEIPGGFDRWLLPGQVGEIRFAFHRPLPPGVYDARVQIQSAGDQEPLTINQRVELQTPGSEVIAGEIPPET